MQVPKWKLRRNNELYQILDLKLDNFTVSKTILNPGKQTLGHSHPHEEVYIFTSGAGSILIGSTVSPVSPGDILHILGNEFHRVSNPDKRKPLIFTCVFKEGKE
jgi:mannose-6-phosphate isomerase-like protein (cupin superfamily)